MPYDGESYGCQGNLQNTKLKKAEKSSSAEYKYLYSHHSMSPVSSSSSSFSRTDFFFRGTKKKFSRWGRGKSEQRYV